VGGGAGGGAGAGAPLHKRTAAPRNARRVQRFNANSASLLSFDENLSTSI